MKKLLTWAAIFVEGNRAAHHFAVRAHGDRTRLLVNTGDPYEGRNLLPSGTFLVEVTAVGEWIITFE